jgi:hypothetical protein
VIEEHVLVPQGDEESFSTFMHGSVCCASQD